MHSKIFRAVALSTTLLTSTGVGMALALGGSAHAQDYTTGALEIVVRDASGAAIEGADISIVSSDTGYARSGVTGQSGSTYFGRMPVGRYSVTVTAEGYTPQVDDNVAVRLGANREITIQLSAGSVTNDVIVVRGQATTGSSFAAAETGLTIDVDEIFDQVPVGRGINSLTLLAPGVVQGDSAFGGASISGSSPAENVYYINGMNITDFRNFLGASTVPFEFYQQVEVKSGGYQAEFGRSTGGVVNAVTRSGSNEWHGGASFYYSPDELREDSPNTQTARNDLDQVTDEEANFWLSGPLIEDRLFFYALYSPQSYEAVNVSNTGRMNIDKRDDPFWGFKFDAYLFDGHSIEWTGFSDARTTERTAFDVTFDNNGDIATRSRVGQTNYEAGGDVNIFKYTGAFTNWFTLSAMYGHQTFNQTTSGENDDCPVIQDALDPTNVVSLGCWSAGQISFGEDTRELYRVDADVFFNFFGDHQVRLGVDREDLSALDQTTYSGGVYYRYIDPESCVENGGNGVDPCVWERIYQNGGEFETIQTAYYIQDSWQVTDQLLLNLGVRNETFDNRNANGDTFTEIDNQIAPRFSAMYDLWGDGRVELFGSYGRYFLPVATNTNLRMSGAELFTEDYYTYTGRNGDQTPILGTLLDQVVFGDGTVPDTRSVVDPNLEPMYKDEFIVGGRWMYNDNLSFAANYTYRSLEQTLEDIAVDAAVIEYCQREGIAGCEDIWTGFHSYVLTNPGSDLTFVTNELPGATGYTDIQLLADDLGYPEASNTYQALELSFDYQDPRLTLRGSWTLSESEGNYEGPVKSDNGQDDAGITTAFDQPGLLDGADGLLPNHRAHKIKLFGSYLLTEDLRVGGNLQITSPRKFGCIGVHPTDVFAQAYGAEAWYCGGELTPRGSQLETDWVFDLDLSAVYALQTLPVGEATFRVDVFNVLNEDTPTDLYEVGETDGGAPLSYYGDPSGFQAPRSIRFGVNWSF